MSRVLLPLNDTVLLLLHPPAAAPRVVQVTVKSAGPETVGTIAAYFRAQHDVADLVAAVLAAHLAAPLPPSATFDDPRYTLAATRRPWTFAREKLRFRWGDADVAPAEDKWLFVFKPKEPAGASSAPSGAEYCAPGGAGCGKPLHS